MIVALPAATAVTIPEAPTVATAALVLLQAPPAAASVSRIVAPAHRLDAPPMVPAAGAVLTVMD